MEGTLLAPGEFTEETSLVPLYAYQALVLHVGQGIAPAATGTHKCGPGCMLEGHHVVAKKRSEGSAGGRCYSE